MVFVPCGTRVLRRIFVSCIQTMKLRQTQERGIECFKLIYLLTVATFAVVADVWNKTHIVYHSAATTR